MESVPSYQSSNQLLINYGYKGIILLVFGKESMTNQFSDLVRIIGITILITFLWAASVAFTYWDTHQQRLPSGKILIWIVLVALLPFIGFIIYLIVRSIETLLPRISNGLSFKASRETALKRPLAKKNPMPTLHVSDLGLQTGQETPSVIPPDSVSYSDAGKYTLTVSAGADLGKEFVLASLPARVGRGSEASIRLDGDLGVSRRHAEIYEQDGTLRIRDLQSTHGTQVNGLRIQDQSLSTGDRIQVGLTELMVKITRE